MSRPLLYLPEVARDYADAFTYYEALFSSAALGFDRAFSQAESEIESGWVTHQRVFADYHRVFIGRFPYTLYYRDHGSPYDDRRRALLPVFTQTDRANPSRP